MTYSALLTAIYADYDRLWSTWTAEMEREGGIGTIVFLPEGYKAAEGLDRASFAYWTDERARSYLVDAGISPDGFDSLLEDVSVAEEFLVMIVEEIGETGGRAVHVHRIGRIGTN